MIWMAASDFITTMNLRKEITESESAISSLETQKEQLTDEKNKLNDPEYVKRFARGKYMVSKPGEQVFKLPSKNTAETDKDE